MHSALKAKVVVPLLLGLAIAFSPMLRAKHDRDDRDRDHHERDNDSPLALLGVIGIPGNPISSTDIAWVDQATERLYFTDRGNGPAYSGTPPAGFKLHGAVDVVDAENDLYIRRITTGTVGGSAVFFSGANSVNRNVGGPNGVAAGANLTVWAGDGDDSVKVGDVNPNSKTYLQIIDSVPLANRSAVSMYGTTHALIGQINFAAQGLGTGGGLEQPL